MIKINDNRIIEFWERRAQRFWDTIEERYTTEKAKASATTHFFPGNSRIHTYIHNRQDEKGLRESFRRVIEDGNWIGVRTCYLPERFGGAPWIMGMKTNEDAEGFFEEKYSRWLEEPEWGDKLREIIVLSNPPYLGVPSYDHEHFVLRVSGLPHQLAVEMRVGTAQLRGLEESYISGEPYIHHSVQITMPKQDRMLEKTELIRVFGGSYYQSDVFDQICECVQTTIRKLQDGFDEDQLRELALRDIGVLKLLFDRYIDRSSIDETIGKIAKHAFSGGYFLSGFDPEYVRNEIFEEMCSRKFDRLMYERLIDTRVLKITEEVERKVFGDWLSSFPLYYRLRGLGAVCGFDTLECQGRFREDGSIDYIKIFDVRGREEKMFAERIRSEF